MSCQPSVTVSCDDIKTDALPDAPRCSEEVQNQDEDVSASLPLKEVSLNEEEKTSSAHLQPPKEPSFSAKKKSSPKSIPRSPKNNKKEKKKTPEAQTCVYQISHSNGIHIGSDYNVTIVQNSSTSKPQAPPKETKTIKDLLQSKARADRKQIMVVAPHVGESWRQVGRILDLTDGRLQQIEQDFHKEGMREVVYQVLVEWMQNKGSDATVGEMVGALWNSAEYSAVKKLAEWSKQCGAV